MKDSVFSNINARFQLTIERQGDAESPSRYMVKLIDEHQDDDKQNPLWIVEPIDAGVYQLTYEQVIVRELVLFGSLGECLNLIRSESLERVAKIMGQ